MENNNVELVYGLVGVIVGFLASFAIFRARFVAIEKDVERLREELKDIKRVCREDDDYRERTERRQRESILILASIARKLGAQSRVTDIGAFLEPEAKTGSDDT